MVRRRREAMLTITDSAHCYQIFLSAHKFNHLLHTVRGRNRLPVFRKPDVLEGMYFPLVMFLLRPRQGGRVFTALRKGPVMYSITCNSASLSYGASAPDGGKDGISQLVSTSVAVCDCEESQRALKTSIALIYLVSRLFPSSDRVRGMKL